MHVETLGTARRFRAKAWREILEAGDDASILRELRRICCAHRLVHVHPDTSISGGEDESGADLSHEIYLKLLEKSRFQHYLEAGMSNREIESEISQIEVQNLLTAELRKRRPESYRLSRRVSELLVRDDSFKQFSSRGTGSPRLSRTLFGLKDWPMEKPTPHFDEAKEALKAVAVRERSCRLVGTTGDAPLIISTADLRDLLLEIFRVAGGPLDVGTVRNFALSKIPHFNVSWMSLTLFPPDGEDGEHVEAEIPFVDPQFAALEDTESANLREVARYFAARVGSAVSHKPRQLSLIWKIFWWRFLGSPGITQLEIARRLGVSDSLVSDYRKRLEKILRDLPLCGADEADAFAEIFRRQLLPLARESGLR